MSLYDDYINSTSKQYFVSFLGRSGVPGHAFVGVGCDIDSGLNVYLRLFGLYPAGGNKLESAKMIFGKTSGQIDYTWKDVKWTVSVKKRVDEQQKDVVLALFDEWSSNAPSYSLLGNGGMNCNMLTGDVARALGMNVPTAGGTTLPWNYIEAIRKKNP